MGLKVKYSWRCLGCAGEGETAALASAHVQDIDQPGMPSGLTPVVLMVKPVKTIRRRHPNTIRGKNWPDKPSEERAGPEQLENGSFVMMSNRSFVSSSS